MKKYKVTLEHNYNIIFATIETADSTSDAIMQFSRGQHKLIAKLKGIVCIKVEKA